MRGDRRPLKTTLLDNQSARGRSATGRNFVRWRRKSATLY